MFPKEKRLNNKDFSRFFGVGKRYHGQNFMMFYLPFPTIKASVVVGKKVSNKAVVRNKLRRRVYSVLKAGFSESGQNSGVFIVVAKKGAENLDFSGINIEVRELIGKVNN